MRIKNEYLTSLMKMLAVVMVCLTINTSRIAAQGPDQGSGTTNLPPGGDPFQLPQPDDPFQLPGVPPIAPAAQQSPIFQKNIVNERYAGWRQISDGSRGTRLDETIRSQWVMADETGRLSGVVYGIENADVGNLTIYLLNNGRVETTTKPKDDGTFTFPNVREGTYSLVGWGDNAFFAFGINILRFNEAADENVPTEIKATATQNGTTLNTDWIQFFSKQVRFPTYGRYETQEDESNDAQRLYGVKGLSLYLPESRPATSISSHQVVPTPDGRVLGRVHQMSELDGRPVELRNTRILLLKEDDVYAAVTTDSYGAFEFPDIPPGEYSCVAVGQDGIGCIGIYLGEPGETGEDDIDYIPISFNLTTSETTGWLNKLAEETAYQRVISRPIYNYNADNTCSSCGQSGCQGGCSGEGSRRLRPGGYRPPPRSAIPKEQRFLKRANRFIDNLFFRDGEIPQSSGPQNFNNGFSGPGGVPMSGGFNPGGGLIAPAAPSFGGSASRTQIPNAKQR